MTRVCGCVCVSVCAQELKISPLPALYQLFSHRPFWIQTHPLLVGTYCDSENHMQTHTFSHSHMAAGLYECLCICRIWYSHDCYFVTAGTFVVDFKIHQFPCDTWLRVWTQTSSRDKRTVWLSHCTDIETGFNYNSIQHTDSFTQIKQQYTLKTKCYYTRKIHR